MEGNMPALINREIDNTTTLPLLSIVQIDKTRQDLLDNMATHAEAITYFLYRRFYHINGMLKDWFLTCLNIRDARKEPVRDLRVLRGMLNY